MTAVIRVLLVDDHALFRSGIKALLSRVPDFEVVGEAGDGLEGVKRAVSLKPDVALLDLNMPGIAGKEAVQLIVEEAPEVKVIVLTVSENPDDLIDVMRAGAQGYLLKNIDAEFLIKAIRCAVEGEAVMAPQMTTRLMNNLRRGARPPMHEEIEKLSPREKEILGFLARGASNKEIARALNLAESTVKIHVQSILRKLNMASRVQVAVFAVEHGIVPKN
ncbi:response regulator [Sulfuricystis multivorans]|uniref:response regulator n=1 Tax=Sulfuricystis multivorans TaxID=2211108 RepID=UPI000F836CAA|nr:response regulator transcription factor [Sulfuricystis multivorans]